MLTDHSTSVHFRGTNLFGDLLDKIFLLYFIITPLQNTFAVKKLVQETTGARNQM